MLYKWKFYRSKDYTQRAHYSFKAFNKRQCSCNIIHVETLCAQWTNFSSAHPSTAEVSTSSMICCRQYFSTPWDRTDSTGPHYGEWRTAKITSNSKWLSGNQPTNISTRRGPKAGGGLHPPPPPPPTPTPTLQPDDRRLLLRRQLADHQRPVRRRRWHQYLCRPFRPLQDHTSSRTARRWSTQLNGRPILWIW